MHRHLITHTHRNFYSLLINYSMNNSMNLNSIIKLKTKTESVTETKNTSLKRKLKPGKPIY